jgi:hypothetical protein
MIMRARTMAAPAATMTGLNTSRDARCSRRWAGWFLERFHVDDLDLQSQSRCDPPAMRGPGRSWCELPSEPSAATGSGIPRTRCCQVLHRPVFFGYPSVSNRISIPLSKSRGLSI